MEDLKAFMPSPEKSSFHLLSDLGYNIRSKSKSALVLKGQRWIC